MKKLLCFVATLSLLLNTLLAPISVLAQTVDESPSPTPVETETPQETVLPTSTPTETPTETPTAIPTELATPTATLEATETPTTTPTDQPVETQAPESSPTVQGPPEENVSQESSATPTATPEVKTENGKISAIILENEKVDETVLNDFDLDYTEDGSATITTDKLDYSPTDTAVISGTGFIAGKTYTINITSSDDPAVDFKDTLVANDEGEILYSYTLDGTYRPDYQVKILDGERIVAETNFTDSRHFGTTTVNGGGTTNVDPSDTVTVVTNVRTDGENEGNDWESTGYVIEGFPQICDNLPDITHDSGFTSSTYDLVAPSNVGSYDLTVIAYSSNGCSGQNNSTSLSNAINVQASCGTTSVYEESSNFDNSEVTISFDSYHNNATVTAKSDYSLISIWYDYQGDWEYDLDDSWPVTTNPAIVHASGDITAIRVTVQKVCAPPADTTPPVITKIISGTSGLNGWYTSNVTVTWTVTDSESTPTVTGCGVQTFTNDTSETTSSCSATSAGGISSDSVTFKIDKTAPSGAATILNDYYGLVTYNSTTINGTATDSGSGVSSVVLSVMQNSTNHPQWFEGCWQGTPPQWGACVPLPVNYNSGNGTWTYGGLPNTQVVDGISYQVYPIITDHAGNTTNGTADIFTWDAGSPTSHVNTLPAYTNAGSISVSYTANDVLGPWWHPMQMSGLKDVDLYYRKDAGSWIKYGTYTTSPISFTFSGDGVYDFYSIARDNALNVEILKTSPETTIVVDTTAPSVPVGGAPNDIAIPTNNFDFTWDSSTDASSITYEFQSSLNSDQVAGVLTTGLWHSEVLLTAMIHSSGAPDGKWYWQVRAIDSYGNTSAWSEIWDVTLDTIAPSAPSLLGDSIIYMKPGNVTRSWQASSSTDVVNYVYKSFTSEVYAQSPNSSPGWSPTPTPAALGQLVYSRTDPTGSGERTFWWRVAAVDGAGNKTWSNEIYKVIVDNTAPTGSWVNPIGNSTVSGTIALNFAAQDNLSGINGDVLYQYKANEGADTFHDIVGNSWDTIGLPLGDYTVRAVVADKAGNVADFNIKVGVAAIISDQNAIGVSSNSITVTWTTDKPTTSRVVFDTVGHDTLGTGDNYGYAFSTVEDTNKVTNHSVTITGLTTGGMYYYRVISHGSPTAIGGEGYVYTLTNAGPPQVSGGAAGVLGTSTGGLLASTFPQLTITGGEEETETESIETESGSSNTEPEVLGVETENKVGGFFGWIKSHMGLSLGIVTLLGLIIFFIIKRRKKKEDQ